MKVSRVLTLLGQDGVASVSNATLSSNFTLRLLCLCLLSFYLSSCVASQHSTERLSRFISFRVVGTVSLACLLRWRTLFTRGRKNSKKLLENWLPRCFAIAVFLHNILTARLVIHVSNSRWYHRAWPYLSLSRVSVISQ